MRKLFGILVIVIIMTALIIGCTPGVEPTPTPSPGPSPTPTPSPGPSKAVKIGVLYDLSGPYAATGSASFVGFEDYMRYINEEQGGVDGVKIEYLWVDHGTKIPEAVSAYKRFRDEGIVLLHCFGSPETTVLSPMVKEDHIPLISTSASKHLYGADSWNYCHFTNTVDGFGFTIDWIDEVHWDYEKRARAPRIAFLGWDSAFGRGTVPGTSKHAKSIGMEVVGEEYFAYGALDVTPQLRRIQDAGADYVLITACNGGLAVPINDGERIGLWETATPCNTWCAPTPPTLKVIGSTANDIFFNMWPWGMWGDGTPGMTLVEEQFTKHHPDKQYDGNYMNGWHQAAVGVEAIRLALQKVDWDDLDGTAVKEQGLDRMEFFDTGGCSGGVSYTVDPDWHIGLHTLRMTKVIDAEAGKFKVVTDWMPMPSLEP